MVKYIKNILNSKEGEVTVKSVADFMKGDIQTIEALMKIIKEKQLTEISLETADIKINIKADPVQEIKKTIANVKKENKVIEKIIDKNHKDIVSEHIGRYNFIKKDGTPMISIGQKIKEGEELGNVIAVGVALPVISKFSGVIEEIYVENGEPVDYGKSLMKVKLS